MKTLLFDQIPSLFSEIADLFDEKKEELCEMDAKLGDGDMGLTMEKGFHALPDLLQAESENADSDIGKLLMKAGMKMSSLIPSTMGFLISTGIMEGGKEVKGKSELDATALTAFLNGFSSGIQKRGKCEIGQRTIFDAISPAATAAEEAARNPASSLSSVMDAALAAAKRGMDSTADMTPVFGKAAVHAAQSAGIPDQGAVAGYYVILGLSKAVQRLEQEENAEDEKKE